MQQLKKRYLFKNIKQKHLTKREQKFLYRQAKFFLSIRMPNHFMGKQFRHLLRHIKQRNRKCIYNKISSCENFCACFGPKQPAKGTVPQYTVPSQQFVSYLPPPILLTYMRTKITPVTHFLNIRLQKYMHNKKNHTNYYYIFKVKQNTYQRFINIARWIDGKNQKQSNQCFFLACTQIVQVQHKHYKTQHAKYDHNAKSFPQKNKQKIFFFCFYILNLLTYQPTTSNQYYYIKIFRAYICIYMYKYKQLSYCYLSNVLHIIYSITVVLTATAVENNFQIKTHSNISNLETTIQMDSAVFENQLTFTDKISNI
eukprot:TRINITY_DN4905_c0_g1_i1.p3 TRINITY_DN4905_c0_g1~~TRINITY_DN4905_c0_g1_i1.p3  ORF type:complete len:312 (+),score=-17.01 TRINITY_DN4905_c0_g1_i1:1647-2582(+)